MRGAWGSSYSEQQPSDHSSDAGGGGGDVGDNQHNQFPVRVTRRKRTRAQSLNPSARKCYGGGTRLEDLRELITTSDNHNADNINVPRSDGENLSITPKNNQLGEERLLNQISPTTRQHTWKSPNMILEGQLSQEVNETNIIPSPVEVSRANDGHLDNARNSHIVHATTKELRSCSMNPSLAPTLQAITTKYGDIARECMLESTITRIFMLEGICKIVQELDSQTLDKLDANSLYGYDLFLKDAERMKINVKWLRVRLGELHDGVKSFVETKLATDEMTKLMERNDYLKKNLQGLKSIIEEQEIELALSTLEGQRLSYKISYLEPRCQRFQSKSLMDGLL